MPLILNFLFVFFKEYIIIFHFQFLNAQSVVIVLARTSLFLSVYNIIYYIILLFIILYLIIFIILFTLKSFKSVVLGHNQTRQLFQRVFHFKSVSIVLSV